MLGAVPAERFVGLDTESGPSSVVTGELGWCKATLVYLVLTWGLSEPIALLRLRVQGRT